MNAQARVLWRRALKAIKTARQLVSDDPDAAGNRAYYAAFYAVSALFALEKKKYSRHSAVEAALHRDLIGTGRWEKGRGAEYSFLLNLRHKGDYGVEEQVSREEADKAMVCAGNIIEAVRKSSKEFED